jgi:hypothetical protein
MGDDWALKSYSSINREKKQEFVVVELLLKRIWNFRRERPSWLLKGTSIPGVARLFLTFFV